MKVLILIRHGESAANVNADYHIHTPDHNIPLTYKGIEQSKKIKFSEELNESSKIYCSPYKRTYETACNALSKEYHNRIIQEPLICERKVKWSWGNEHYNNVIENWKEKGSFWWKGIDHEFESGADVYQRASVFLNKITLKHFLDSDSKTVYVFTHGFFMNMFRIALIGNECLDFNDYRKNPKNCEQWYFSSEDGKEWKFDYNKIIK